MIRTNELRGYMVLSWGVIGMQILKWSADAQYMSDKDITSVDENIRDVKCFLRLKHGYITDPYGLAFGRIVLSSHQAIEMLRDDGVLKKDTAEWAHYMVSNLFRRNQDLNVIKTLGLGTLNAHATRRN